MLVKLIYFMLKYNKKGERMAKDSKKQKTKARINWGWDAPENRSGKATRSTKKSVQVTDDISINVSTKRSRNKIKRLGFKAILIVLLVTLIGGAIGAGVCWFVSRDDCFTIIGNEEITLTLEDNGEQMSATYFDEGVKVISFGRNISSKVTIETDMRDNKDGSFTANEVGTYYIIYKVNDIKYGKIFTVERIRLITFVEPTPDNIVEPEVK